MTPGDSAVGLDETLREEAHRALHLHARLLATRQAARAGAARSAGYDESGFPVEAGAGLTARVRRLLFG
jgi:hypothetical protein